MTSVLSKRNKKEYKNNNCLELFFNAKELELAVDCLPAGYSLTLLGRQRNTSQRLLQNQFNSAKDLEDDSNYERESNDIQCGLSQKKRTDFEVCCELLLKLKQNPDFTFFIEKRNVSKDDMRGVAGGIGAPPELREIESKLRSHAYESIHQFTISIKQLWQTDQSYIDIHDERRELAKKLDAYFDNLVGEVVCSSTIKNTSKTLKNKRKNNGNKEKTVDPLQKTIYSRISLEKPLTYQEKRQLCNMLRLLPVEYLYGVWKIVKNGEQYNGQNELEFDIDVLPVQVARELEKYVQTKLYYLNKRRTTSSKRSQNDRLNATQPSIKTRRKDTGRHAISTTTSSDKRLSDLINDVSDYMNEDFSPQSTEEEEYIAQPDIADLSISEIKSTASG